MRQHCDCLVGDPVRGKEIGQLLPFTVKFLAREVNASSIVKQGVD
jgi:hypothetical protein